MDAGLESNDYHLAAYLRLIGCVPQQVSGKLVELRKESRNAQRWLEKKYHLAERKWVTWINIERNGLEDGLVISDWTNLEKLECKRNQLTCLTLNNLPKLKEIYA